MAKLIKFGEFIGPGERLSAAALEKELPSHWVVICNKEIVAASGNVREIDLIVMGEHALYVIEEKHWHGRIHGNENGWVMPSGESRGSPLSQVEDAARRVAGRLRANVALLDHVMGPSAFVHGLVLLSADRVSVSVHDPRKDRIILLKSASAHLKDLDASLGRRRSLSNFRAKIERELIGLQDRPKVPRKVADFKVKECLPARGPIRCLRGSHPDGSSRILKLVERPTTLDEARRREQEELIKREYQALRRLAFKGCAPAVDSYFSWEQEAYWVFPIHPIEGMCLQADRHETPPGAEKIWEYFEESLVSLKQVHDENIIHRALAPDTVFIGASGRVIFSDFVIARMEGKGTIATEAEGILPTDPFRSPEENVDLGLSVTASDLFSLVLTLYYWVTGKIPALAGGVYALDVPALRPDLPGGDSALLQKLFTECLVVDERQRPTVTDLLDRLHELHPETMSAPTANAARLLPEEGPPLHCEEGGPAALAPKTLVEDQYEIVRKLGQGATATTYLALDTVADELFVLKQIRFPELAKRLAKTEFRSLKDLDHPGLPRVFDIRPPSKPFHLKLEYVEGKSLRAQRDTYLFQPTRCRTLGLAVLDALTYLEDKGLIHRDLSPTNILVPEDAPQKAVIIDFDLATLKSNTQGSVGTPPYRAPEIDHGGAWTIRCDLYSMGVILFELATGRLPYSVDGSHRDKDLLLPCSAEEERRLGRPLVEALLVACASDPDKRYQTAVAFTEALKGVALPSRHGGERLAPTEAAAAPPLPEGAEDLPLSALSLPKKYRRLAKVLQKALGPAPTLGAVRDLDTMSFAAVKGVGQRTVDLLATLKTELPALVARRHR